MIKSKIEVLETQSEYYSIIMNPVGCLPTQRIYCIY